MGLDAKTLAKRVVRLLTTLLAVSFLTFMLTSLLPGDPAYTILGAEGVTPEAVARVHQDLGGDGHEAAGQERAQGRRVARRHLGPAARARADRRQPGTDQATAEPGATRLVLSLREGSRPLREAAGPAGTVQVLHGPEGGLAPHEEDLALGQGFLPAGLGARVLRAETASVAALSLLACA